MGVAPLPSNEAARLEMLRLYEVLDSAHESDFDDITRTAAQSFGVPIAVISLVDTNRQWFKSCVGLEVSETGRDVSFCGHAILSNSLMIIPDARLDPRFADNPLVIGEPRIRFYAGAPLLSDGYALGTLCLIDQQPRQLTPAQTFRLEQMASTVVMRLKLRLASLRLARLDVSMKRQNQASLTKAV